VGGNMKGKNYTPEQIIRKLSETTAKIFNFPRKFPTTACHQVATKWSVKLLIYVNSIFNGPYLKAKNNDKSSRRI
jgi:hypothetical protein